MPFTKQGPYTAGGNFTFGNANNMEVQYDEARQTINAEAQAPFVEYGGVCTIHGGLPKQMDVTTCIYWPLQAVDYTIRERVINATFFTTVTASTTYFLDFNPDGSTSWGTAHSGVTNYVPIASVTTDGSGNIAVITDVRPTNIHLWPSAVGAPAMAGKFIVMRGSHSGVAFTLSAGNGAPGSLDTNEIYFQLT
jgi:hypothetical protein